jgi:hypothetical protein
VNSVFLILVLSNPYLAPDKVEHFSLSALGTATTYRFLGDSPTTLQRIVVSSLWMSIGLYKEKTDAVVDLKDLRSDAFGVIYGNILTIRW